MSMIVSRTDLSALVACATSSDSGWVFESLIYLTLDWVLISCCFSSSDETFLSFLECYDAVVILPFLLNAFYAVRQGSIYN